MKRLLNIQKTLTEATGREFPIVEVPGKGAYLTAKFEDLSAVEEMFGEKKAQSLLIAGREVPRGLDAPELMFVWNKN